jgi:hypothetical protein
VRGAGCGEEALKGRLQRGKEEEEQRKGGEFADPKAYSRFSSSARGDEVRNCRLVEGELTVARISRLGYRVDHQSANQWKIE